MKNALIRILPWVLMLPTVAVHAQDKSQELYQQFCPPNPGPGDVGCINISSKDRLLNLIAGLIGYLRTIFWLFAVGMLIYAAYLYLSGGANEKNVAKAKQVLTYAVIGMVLGLVAASVPFLVKNILSTGQ
jgi:hypothetical protein